MSKQKKDEFDFKSWLALVGIAISMIFSIWGTFAGIVLYFCRRLLYFSDLRWHNRIIITAVFGGFLIFCSWWWSLFSSNFLDVLIDGFWYELYTIQGWLGTQQYSSYGFTGYLKHYTHLFCFSMFFFPLYFSWINDLFVNPYKEQLKRAKKAQHMKEKEVKESKVKKGAKESLAYEVATGKPFNLELSDFAENFFLFGTTGAGKTVTLFNLIGFLLEKDLPLIFVDGKGDDNNLKDKYGNIVHSENKKYKKLEKIAQKVGKKLYTWNCGNFDKWDFLAVGSLSELKDKIIGLGLGADSSATEYYRDNDDVLLLVILNALKEMGERVTIDNIIQLCDLENLKELSRFKDVPEVVKQKVKLISHMKEKDINGLKNKLLKMYLSDFYQYLDGGFNLKNVIQNGDMVYISLPNVTSKKSAEMLGQMAINDYKTCLQYNHSQKPVAFVLDEFTVFCGEQSIELATQTRSIGSHTILATQDVSGLVNRVGEHYVNQMINNSNFLMVQKLNGASEREFLSKQFGTSKAFKVTAQIDTNTTSSNTGMGSVREVEEFRVHPNDIDRLQKGQAYIRKKVEPYIFEKKIKINNNLDL